MMDDFVSESESDYTSYWRDWVSRRFVSLSFALGNESFCRLIAATRWDLQN